MVGKSPGTSSITTGGVKGKLEPIKIRGAIFLLLTTLEPQFLRAENSLWMYEL